MGRIYFHDFKHLYILDVYVQLKDLCIAVNYFGCEMQLVLPNTCTIFNEKKLSAQLLPISGILFIFSGIYLSLTWFQSSCLAIINANINNQLIFFWDFVNWLSFINRLMLKCKVTPENNYGILVKNLAWLDCI